ncbi:MAG: polysaccharide biosynthesis C-terminal domain-containing protein [Mariniblastus sp.]
MSSNDLSANEIKPKKKRPSFLGSSLIYALGDLLTKGARIVLIPYYIAVFTKPEMGEWGILQAISIASFTLLTFGLGFATRRFHNQYGENGDSLVTTFWVGRMLAGLPLFGLLLLAGYGLQQWSSNPISFGLIACAITTGFLRGGTNIVESWLNIREEPFKYRAFTFLQFLTTTLLVIYLVSWCKWGLFGAIIGETISFAGWTVISGVLLFRRSLPTIAGFNWREIGFYCWPTLPHAFFMWAVMSADRLMLQEYVTKSELGVYEIGYSLAGFLSIVIMGIRAAWMPRYFRTADEPDAGQQYGKFATIYFYLILFTATAGILFIPELLSLIKMGTGKDYTDSIHVFRVVLVGIVALSGFMAFNQPLLYQRRTGLIAMASGFGFAVNIGCNLCLIPQLGIMGSAIATVITYVCMATTMFVLVSFQKEIHWQTRTNGLILLLSAAIACSVLFLPSQIWDWTFIVRLSLMLAFPLLTLFKFELNDQRQLQIGFRLSRFKLSL